MVAEGASGGRRRERRIDTCRRARTSYHMPSSMFGCVRDITQSSFFSERMHLWQWCVRASLKRRVSARVAFFPRHAKARREPTQPGGSGACKCAGTVATHLGLISTSMHSSSISSMTVESARHTGAKRAGVRPRPASGNNKRDPLQTAQQGQGRHTASTAYPHSSWTAWACRP